MVATFLGNSPMNILRANHGFDVSGQLLPCPHAMRERIRLAPGQGFDLGIRPENIYLSEPHKRRDHRGQQELGELIVEVKVVEPLGRETLIRGGLYISSQRLGY